MAERVERPENAGDQLTEQFVGTSTLNPIALFKLFRAYLVDGWPEMSQTLAGISTDADVIVTGMTYQEVAFNVAERFGIPLVSLHWCPLRSNGYTLPIRLPKAVRDLVFMVTEWAYWRALKPADDLQRLSLGLCKATKRSALRIVERGTLEMQAYDKALFPGLEMQWPGRPFVGFLGLNMGTSNDSEVLSWIEKGTPPVYFGFGSTPVESPERMLELIHSVCVEVGVRALVNCSGWKLTSVPPDKNVLVVDRVNYRRIFPKCLAVVHHGGAGTVAEGLRSGVPTVAVWSTADQPLWARRIEALDIGVALKLSRLTRESLLNSLQKALGPGCADRVKNIAAQMTSPTEGVCMAADLVEDAAMSYLLRTLPHH